MFYKQSDIENHLSCGICKMMLRDPRVLPCGHTFCHKCLELDKFSCVSCQTCQQSHTSPPSGFPVNSIIVMLLNEHPKKVNQSSKVRELRENLDKIVNKCAQVEKKSKSGSVEIEDFCQSLMNEVDIETELRLEEVRQNRDLLNKQIDDYRRDCINNYENVPYECNLENVKEFVTMTDEILSCHEIDENELVDLIRDSSRFIKELDDQEQKIVNHKFNNQLLTFTRNQSKLLAQNIGQLSYRKIGIGGYKLAEFNEIKFPSNGLLLNCLALFTANRPEFSSVIELDYTFGIFTSQSDSLVAKLNLAGSTVLSFLPVDDGFIFAVRLFVRKNHQLGLPNLIIVKNRQYHIGNQHGDCVIKVNKNYDFINHLSLSYQSRLQASNGSNIFILSSENLIKVYNAELIGCYRQIEANIPAHALDMQANETKLFILHTDVQTFPSTYATFRSMVPINQTDRNMKLRVFNLQNNLFEKDIELGSSLNLNQMKLLSTRYLVLFDNKENKLCVLSQKDMNKVAEIATNLTTTGLSMTKDSTKFITFYDPKGTIWYSEIVC